MAARAFASWSVADRISLGAMRATIGSTVHYRLSAGDAGEINRRRAHAAARMREIQSDALGYVAHIGNSVAEGQVFPAVVVAVWGDGSSANLHVLLDGSDSYWATSRTEGDDAGHWVWPPRA